MEWFVKEHAELSTWKHKLQPCPCSLSCSVKSLCLNNTTTRKACGETPAGFQRQSIPNIDGSHDGTVYELRQNCDGFCEPGTQCTYDANGDLLTTSPGAGSADRYSGGCTRGIDPNPDHMFGDAAPYYCALELEEIGTGVPSLRYYEYVRPNNSGLKCDPNPIAFITESCYQCNVRQRMYPGFK
jgi:hypothetical protein